MKHTVIHAGYPGDSSRAMLKRMDHDVIRHKPDTVVIECGANDAVNPAALTTVEESTANLKKMDYCSTKMPWLGPFHRLWIIFDKSRTSYLWDCYNKKGS